MAEDPTDSPQSSGGPDQDKPEHAPAPKLAENYRKPPERTRWKKGVSGNPAGRKKGSRNFKTDLQAIMAETVEINESGRRRRLTKQQAFITLTVARALGGDPKQSGMLLNLLLRFGDAAGGEPEVDPGLSAGDQARLEAFLKRNARTGGKP